MPLCKMLIINKLTIFTLFPTWFLNPIFILFVVGYMSKRPVFLSAEWNYLAMLNYRVPEEILIPHLPAGTELDKRDGHAMMSVVGFLFNKTRVLGLQWPFHTNFEEVNLRFYIRHFDGKEWKRGVAFISEIVPSPAIAFIAKRLYNEPYRSMRMKHKLYTTANELSVEYSWKNNGNWNSITVTAEAGEKEIETNSDAEFILEHYWGYNQISKNKTVEYQVEHPRWKIFPVKNHRFICNTYAEPFASYLKAAPHSVFLARGSEVIVRKPKFLHV